MRDESSLSGKRFGRLVVIEKVGKANSHGTLWRCKCDCGNIKDVRREYLTSGGTSSCGCLRNELRSKTAYEMGEKNVRHGHCRRNNMHPLFNVWRGMRSRCKDPKHISYKTYGAKGISVCKEWDEDFVAFYEWCMANGYKKGLALDRIDPKGNYEPDNCRFITQAENNRRQKRTIWIEHNGKRLTIPQWAEELGMEHSTIRYRYNKGLPIDEILDPKKRPNHPARK